MTPFFTVKKPSHPRTVPLVTQQSQIQRIWLPQPTLRLLELRYRRKWHRVYPTIFNVPCVWIFKSTRGHSIPVDIPFVVHVWQPFDNAHNVEKLSRRMFPPCSWRTLLLPWSGFQIFWNPTMWSITTNVNCRWPQQLRRRPPGIKRYVRRVHCTLPMVMLGGFVLPYGCQGL